MKVCVCQWVPVMSEEVMSVGQCNYSPFAVLSNSGYKWRVGVWVCVCMCGVCMCVFVNQSQDFKSNGNVRFDSNQCLESRSTYTLLCPPLREDGRMRGPERSGRRSPGWWEWRPAGPPIPAAGRFLASLEVSGFYHIALFSCPGRFGHLRDLRHKKGEGGRMR